MSERSRRRWVRASAVALLAAVSLSAGSGPFREALQGIHSPADFTRDYVGAHALLHGGVEAIAALQGQAANDYAAALGAPRLALYDGPYQTRPPGGTLLVLALVPLGFRAAALLWFLASLAALAWLAHRLAATLTAPGAPKPYLSAGLFALLAVWPPVLHNLAKGQWSIFLALLVALGWHALTRGRPHGAGAWIGAAGALKLTPLLLVGHLGLRHRRAALGMGLAFAALTLLGAATGDTGLRFTADIPKNTETWQTWTANTASVNGLVARLFAGGPWARPLWHAPVVARALTLAIGAALVLVALRATRCRDRDDAALHAAWCTLTVLLNPLAWSHTLVMALLPVALIARRAPAVPLLAIVGVFSIPRQTLARIAALAPGEPITAPIVSLHALAALGLFALALRAAAGRGGEPAAPASASARSPGSGITGVLAAR